MWLTRLARRLAEARWGDAPSVWGDASEIGRRNNLEGSLFVSLSRVPRLLGGQDEGCDVTPSRGCTASSSFRSPSSVSELCCLLRLPREGLSDSSRRALGPMVNDEEDAEGTGVRWYASAVPGSDDMDDADAFSVS